MLEALKKRLTRQKAKGASGLFCVTITPQTVCLGYMNHPETKAIQFIEIHSYRAELGFEPVLLAAMKKHALEDVDCAWVLTPDHYQLLLLDAMPVTDTEFQSAIRWKIKGMLPFPVEEALVDHFAMPLQKTHDPRPMMLIAATRRGYIEEQIEKLKACGLNVTRIEIQETALRNITALYEDDEKTTAFIYLREKSSELIITCQRQIYFQRHLDLGLSTLGQIANLDADKNPNAALDKAALELQRSFDYYQSQWRQPPPSRLFLAVSEFSATSIANYLSSRLAMPIQPFDASEKIDTKKILSVEMQGRSLPVMGGLLRDDSANRQEVNFSRLLPKKRRFQASFEQLALAYGIFLLLLLLTTSVDLWKKHSRTKALFLTTQTIAMKQSKLDRLAEQYPVLNSKDLEAAMLDLQKDLETNGRVITSLSAGRAFSLYLRNIAMAYFPGAWLTEITVTTRESEINLRGQALYANAVQQFLNQLIKQPVFVMADLELRELNQVGSGSNQYLDFYITSKADKR